MILSRRSDGTRSGGHGTGVGALGKFLTGLATVVVLVTAASGVSAASGGTQPTITTTEASFVIPQGPSVPPIGTTWMLKLQDLTSTIVLGTATFTTTEGQPTSTLSIPVPTVEGCNFQVDVRTTPPGQPVDPKSGTFYSDLIMVVPNCGPAPAVTPTTTTTTTTTNPVVPPATTPPTTPTVVPGHVAATSQLPFTDASVSSTATTATASELPFTGVDVPFLFGLGLLLIGLGSLLMRRREVKLLSLSALGESDPDR